jgi:hypothetical protein
MGMIVPVPPKSTVPFVVHTGGVVRVDFPGAAPAADAPPSCHSAWPALLGSDALDTVFGDGLQDVKPFEIGVAQIERFVASGAGVRLAKLL